MRGVRVRNLLDAADVTKLGAKAEAAEAQIVAVEWNGLDDYGRSVPDWTYQVRVCSHPGLRCIYEYSILNPGLPPWEHYKNSGLGGDHEYPHATVCSRSHKNGADEAFSVRNLEIQRLKQSSTIYVSSVPLPVTRGKR